MSLGTHGREGTMGSTPIHPHLCLLLVLSWVGSIRDTNARSGKAGEWGPALMVSALL